MKKFFSVILVLIMAMSLFVPAFAKENCDCEKTPVIMISGFGATTLVRIFDDGSEKAVFPPSVDDIVSIVKKHINKFDKDNLTEFVYPVIEDILDPIRMNADGTSYYNIKPIYSSVEDTSYDGFTKNNATSYIPYADSDFLDMKSASERLGGDHVFNFMYDWRKSGDEVADELLSYIERVREFTGHDKVSIYCLSQGSVPVAQYLYKYADRGYIENLLFDNPIFDGSYFVSDIMSGEKEMNFNVDEILDLLENIIHVEINISEILNALPSDKIDPFVNKQVKLAAEKIILPTAKNAPAYLEMAPNDEYERIVNTYYGEEGCEKLVEKTDKVMNGYRSDIEETLRSAMKCGIDVSVLSCSGFGLATGGNAQSDAIVNLTSSCGAYCNPMGEPFDSSYVQKKDVGKYCISPDRTIDLSCGYLPEKTWIINERYHGQGEWAPDSLALIEELLYTHNLKDAWSSYDFPQFMQSDDPGNDIFASFRDTNSLITVRDGKGILVIKNTSNKFSELIRGIYVDETELSFNAPFILRPGEECTAEINTSENTSGKIRVSYCSSDNMLVGKDKIFSYTVTDSYGGVVSETETPDYENGIIKSVLAKAWQILLKLFRTAESIFFNF